ncbi:MAG: NADH-quinone oxidoreductase subunit, partial [Nocardioidaceae bacterium]|nr:NADH-quinone oxidoreductase subunit [Nocardioidaceae bacterium]
MIVAGLVVPFVVGALLMLFRGDVPGRVAALLGAAAMTTSLVLFAVAWDGGSPRGRVDVMWIKPLNAHFHVGLTPFSWPFLLMTAFLGLLCCIWLIADDTHSAVVGLVLVISASSLGVFASLDLLLFFVFFELALIPMWFLIAWWGDPHDPVGRRRAATRFLLFTVSGSALLLVGIVIVAVQSKSLEIFEISSGSVVAVSLIAIGFAVKTPLVPLHTWLPDAHSKAPTVGSVLLAGVFLKLGTYGLLLLG